MLVAMNRLEAGIGRDLSQLPWDAATGFDITVDDHHQALLSEAEGAFRDFLDGFQKFEGDGTSAMVAEEANAFVVKLGLPWPWLSLELVQLFWARLFVKDYSWDYLDGFSTEPAVYDLPAPAVDLSFRTEEGGTVWQALDRFRKEANHFEDRLTGFYEPWLPGSVPKKTRNSLKRCAFWLYRHKVAKESIRSISIRDFGDAEHRKHIRLSIKRAEELLSLTTYSF